MNKVAVYGSLRKGLHNHSFLTTSDFLGTDIVEGFKMYSLGSYPFIATSDQNDPIQVEVYEVNDAVFRNLDRLEGYPSFYDRKEIDTEFGTAWIYHIDNEDESLHTRVQNGDWKAYLGE